MTFSDPTVFTPYSGVKPLMNDGQNLWAPETDRDRLGAYQKFEEIYWSHDTAFTLQDDSLERPVFIPNPRVICDSTSHFWMKGFEVVSKGPTQVALDAFLDREEFIPKFHVAKHSGVVRGDFVLHLTADPTKPEGSRVSVNSVDPGMYFPEFDDHNLDRILAVNLVEQIIDPVTEKPLIHRLRYRYVLVGGVRKVTSQEAWYEVRDWFKETRVQIKQLRAEVLLPDPIDTIPVYLFKNQPWQGDPFGSSEIRGYEALQQRINQSATDEDMALALEGLGVYTTDAPPPTDEAGAELAWNIVPGRVVQTPAGAKFERVKGVSSVEPFQAHIDMMVEGMYESSATFRAQLIDDKTAESGIALAIRFLPTLAKLEERDFFGVARLTQFFFDWKNWHAAFESQILPGDIEIVLGDKLPNNKTDKLNVYNNLMDRKAISKKWYREQVGELYGVEIPADMDKQIEDESRAAMELMQEFQPEDTKTPENSTVANGNRSNNRNRTNESGGTEANSGSSKRG